jgi:hypothetical protein
MRKHYMVEVGLRGDSLRIEADDQNEAIRFAQDVILENGLLIYIQREPAEDEAHESTIVIWRPGHERNLKPSGMSPVTGLDIRPIGRLPPKIDALIS